MIIKLIFEDIMNALQQYGLYAISASLLLLLIIVLIRGALAGQGLITMLRTDYQHFIFLILTLTYLAMVITITILSREPGSRDSVNLELFATITKDIYGNVFPVENILLFIPLGLLLPLTWRWFSGGVKVVTVGILASILIELTQYITRRGYLQTDDVITNMLGALCGYLVYLVYRKWIGKNRYTNISKQRIQTHKKVKKV